MSQRPPDSDAKNPGIYLSIVIPVYNEQDRVEHCLTQVRSWCATLDYPVEIIVVDDGSGDDTVSIASTFARNDDRVRLLKEPHRGKANAVLAGLHLARGQYAGFCDVDLATPMDTWHICERHLQQGASVAIASREGHGAIRIGEPWYRHAMGRAFNALIRMLLLPGVHDTQCGFKFFTQNALETILPRCALYAIGAETTRARVTAFDVELLYIARTHGLTIAVIPVTWKYGTQTKVNPVADTLQNLWDVLRVRWYGWRGRYR